MEIKRFGTWYFWHTFLFCMNHNAYRSFSYDGERKLSKQIIEGTAHYVTLPEGGIGLDVGCGSGALTHCLRKAQSPWKVEIM